MRKSRMESDTSAAYYEVIESEAAVVRRVYQAYTQQGLMSRCA
jgi:hypothetical protein